MNLPQDFAELLSALLAAEARFLVVGGHAVITYSEPRYTKDLDLWVDPTIENAHRVADALAAFGAPSGYAVEDFVTLGRIVAFGQPPLRVDILTQIDGVPDFGPAWDGRTTVAAGPIAVPVLGRAELIANKRAAGRPRDLKDLRALLRETP